MTEIPENPKTRGKKIASRAGQRVVPTAAEKELAASTRDGGLYDPHAFFQKHVNLTKCSPEAVSKVIYDWSEYFPICVPPESRVNFIMMADLTDFVPRWYRAGRPDPQMKETLLRVLDYLPDIGGDSAHLSRPAFLAKNNIIAGLAEHRDFYEIGQLLRQVRGNTDALTVPIITSLAKEGHIGAISELICGNAGLLIKQDDAGKNAVYYLLREQDAWARYLLQDNISWPGMRDELWGRWPEIQDGHKKGEIKLSLAELASWGDIRESLKSAIMHDAFPNYRDAETNDTLKNIFLPVFCDRDACRYQKWIHRVLNNSRRERE